MSIWNEFGNKLGNVRSRIRSAREKGRAAKTALPKVSDKRQDKVPRQKYEYHEPEASVLLNQIPFSTQGLELTVYTFKVPYS